MNKGKLERGSEFRLSRQDKKALTRLALADNCSRSEWIRKAIRRAAMRKGLWEN